MSSGHDHEVRDHGDDDQGEDRLELGTWSS